MNLLSPPKSKQPTISDGSTESPGSEDRVLKTAQVVSDFSASTLDLHFKLHFANGQLVRTEQVIRPYELLPASPCSRLKQLILANSSQPLDPLLIQQVF